MSCHFQQPLLYLYGAGRTFFYHSYSHLSPGIPFLQYFSSGQSSFSHSLRIFPAAGHLSPVPRILPATDHLTTVLTEFYQQPIIFLPFLQYITSGLSSFFPYRISPTDGHLSPVLIVLYQRPVILILFTRDFTVTGYLSLAPTLFD